MTFSTNRAKVPADYVLYGGKCLKTGPPEKREYCRNRSELSK